MSNVINAFGQEDIAAVCELLLANARAGRLVGMAVVMDWGDQYNDQSEETPDCYVGGHIDVLHMVGALRLVEHSLLADREGSSR